MIQETSVVSGALAATCGINSTYRIVGMNLSENLQKVGKEYYLGIASLVMSEERLLIGLVSGM